MAVRTYIPGILAFAKYLKKYVAKNSVILKEKMGNGLYAVIVLVVDLLIIAASLIDAGHTEGDQWSEFNAVNTLTSSTLNEVQAAISKFYESIGVTP